MADEPVIKYFKNLNAKERFCLVNHICNSYSSLIASILRRIYSEKVENKTWTSGH